MFYFKIFGSLLSAYMLITAHYPTNFDVASGGLRTRSALPETSGLWVRVAGGCFLADIWVWEYSSMLATVLSVAGGIALVLSFMGDFSKIR